MKKMALIALAVGMLTASQVDSLQATQPCGRRGNCHSCRCGHSRHFEGSVNHRGRPVGTRQDHIAAHRAAQQPWHGPYAYTPAGQPVALVVPPTANMQTHMGWGVGRTQMTPIYHQFSRHYPGEMAGSTSGYQSTPPWPTHSTQFGVYPVRAPW